MCEKEMNQTDNSSSCSIQSFKVSETNDLTSLFHKIQNADLNITKPCDRPGPVQGLPHLSLHASWDKLHPSPTMTTLN